MESLNLTGVDYDDVSEKRNSLSYVIINPSCDLNLQEGDIMWVSMYINNNKYGYVGHFDCPLCVSKPIYNFKGI